MANFENTGYGKSQHYNQGESSNEFEDWTSKLDSLERFNHEHTDILPSDWLDFTMPSYTCHNSNLQEMPPLGTRKRTIIPDALPHASTTLSALPSNQTHPTAVDYQTQSCLENIDPRIFESQSSYSIYPEQFLAAPSRRRISSSSEEVQTLRQEVARLKEELLLTQQELKREQEARHRLETQGTLKKKPVSKPKLDDDLSKGEPKNARTANIKNFHADDYYEPIQEVPADWVGPATGRSFTYTAEGELDPEAKFSPEELQDFLLNHPQNHPLVNCKPILWIGNVPADSGNRYPTKESAACRFQNCPIPNHTIRKGLYRVTIDEWGYHPEWEIKDPFHNAGYVHLYCLEKFMDLPGLYRYGVAVFADTREFKEGRNKMAITRDYPSMREIVEDYLQYAPSLGVDRAPGLDGWYKDSLSLQLTEEHLKRQPATRQSVRGDRGGNSVDVHKNNLDVLIANQKTRRLKPLNDPNTPKRKYTKRAANRGIKRKTTDAPSDVSDDDDEEFEIDSNVLESVSDTPPRETRAAKRQKLTATPSWQMNGANRVLDTVHGSRAVRDWMNKNP